MEHQCSSDVDSPEQKNQEVLATPWCSDNIDGAVMAVTASLVKMLARIEGAQKRLDGMELTSHEYRNLNEATGVYRVHGYKSFAGLNSSFV